MIIHFQSNQITSPPQDELAWAVAVGTISFLVTLVMTIMLMCKKNIDWAHPIVSLGMVILWTAGVGVCTFNAPFKYACSTSGLALTSASGSANGYFATWICFIASCRYLAASIDKVKELAHTHNNELLFLLLIASLTVMAQSVADAPDAGEWSDMQIWATTCSIISSFLAILMMLEAVRQYNKYISAVLACLWMAAVATLTFSYANSSIQNLGMYSIMGNGFFGCWVSFFISFIMCFSAWVAGHAEGSMNDPNTYLATLLVASLFELWAAASLCDQMGGSKYCNDEYAWAVAVGAISTLTCLVLTIMMLCGKSVRDAHPVVAILMLILWSAGMGVLTFVAPFKSACSATVVINSSSAIGSSANGYIATWICFLASIGYVSVSVQKARGFTQGATNRPLGVLLIASAVVCAQASIDGSKGSFTSIQIWALICSVLSLFGAILMLLEAARPYNKQITLMLATLWFIAVATLTYVYKDNSDLGIYANAGNGFFGTWGAFFVAFSLAYTAHLGQGHSDQGHGTAGVV